MLKFLRRRLTDLYHLYLSGRVMVTAGNAIRDVVPRQRIPASLHFTDYVMSQWKQYERFVSSIFSTVRTALSGGNGKVTRSDSHHPALFISCKYTASNNKGLRTLVDEEREKALVENKIAICVIGEAGDRANSLVVLHLKDLSPFCEMVKNGTVACNMESSSKRTKSVGTGDVAG